MQLQIKLERVKHIENLFQDTFSVLIPPPVARLVYLIPQTSDSSHSHASLSNELVYCLTLIRGIIRLELPPPSLFLSI